MRKIIVDEKYNGKNLNRFLLDNFEGLSLNNLNKALRKKDIKVNGKRVNNNITIYTGDNIEVYIIDEILYANKKIDIDIVYEDENIIVVNKPNKIEVTGDNSLTTLLEKKYNQKIYPCHRLDRNTTGIILFAKNEEALEILLNKFKNREIEKHYACMVYGIPKEDSKVLTAYLFKDAKKSFVYISDIPKKGYQKIITQYTVLKKMENNTAILDVNLHTGRTHQIRALLAHIGFPIIGDGKYGIRQINEKFKANTQNLCSYLLKFNFTTDSGKLNYLNHREFKIYYNFLSSSQERHIK